MKTYKEDDEVVFHIDGPIKYQVKRTYLYSVNRDNEFIFKQLCVDKETFCTQAYGYEAGSGDCPTYNIEDYAAASRLIEALHVKCGEERLSIAKKRYPIGTKYTCAHSNAYTISYKYTVDEQSFSIPNEYQVYGESGQGCLYHDGKWAEIVSKPDSIPTPEEPEPMFKIGDEVLITKGHSNWSIQMNQYCGKIATLKGFGFSGSFKIDLDEGDWHWNYGDGHFVKAPTLVAEEATFSEESIEDKIARLYPVGTEFYPIDSYGKEYPNIYVVKPEDNLRGDTLSSWFGASYKSSHHPGYVQHNGTFARIIKMGKTDTKKSTLKYKIGDKVRLIKGYNGIDENMMGTVCDADSRRGVYLLHEWVGNFSEDVLELVDEIKQEAPKSTYEFQVGDNVKVVEMGYGCASTDIDKIVQITEQGRCFDNPGYKVSPPIGNSKSGEHGGFIGEKSFEKFDFDRNTKPLSVSVTNPWAVTSGLLSTDGRVIGIVGRKIEAKPTNNKIKKVNFTRI
jgi:transcription antitermination factor NusG